MKTLVLGDIEGRTCWEEMVDNDEFIVKNYGT